VPAVLIAAAMLAGGSASASAGPTWSLSASPDVTIPSDGPDAVSCPTAGHCVAVGGSVTASGDIVPLVKAWNGHAWSVQRVPLPAGAAYPALSGFSCTSARFCLAVGQYRLRITSQNTIRLAERWNGKAWAIVLRTGAGDLDAVSCPASTCVAVGSSGSGPVADSWNGTGWTPQTLAAGATSLTAISCSAASTCMTVGSNGTSPAAEY
jgi:hypothetical protein